jgi:coenzyme Q-binding protein COQ10
MPQFETKRRVRHSATNMFDLVADVERYPEFVPLCENLRIIRRETGGAEAGTETDTEVIVATMTVAYKLFRENFTSRVVLDRKRQEIHVTYLDGPFRFLENRWKFRELEDDVCEVGFLISYEFRSKMLGSLMGAVFDRAFRKFATAFEERADQVYGKRPLGNGGSSPRTV